LNAPDGPGRGRLLDLDPIPAFAAGGVALADAVGLAVLHRSDSLGSAVLELAQKPFGVLRKGASMVFDDGNEIVDLSVVQSDLVLAYRASKFDLHALS
jgi:hypothetical protein